METYTSLKRYRLLLSYVGILLIIGACTGSREETAQPQMRGGISGVFSLEEVMESSGANTIKTRTAAFLGIFVSEYLSMSPSAIAAESALLGIDAQLLITDRQSMIDDPDFELLQAFADALQVDVPDLLNRSVDRAEALEAYTISLTNVAQRANDRFKELESILEEVQNTANVQKKELSTAERALNTALRDKDFSTAGELQKDVNDHQALFAESDLKRNQLQELIDTMDRLLLLYGEKIFAIQSNREALIAGTKVVDVPGIEDLDVLERQKRTRTRPGDSEFDQLFDERRVL